MDGPHTICLLNTHTRRLVRPTRPPGFFLHSSSQNRFPDGRWTSPRHVRWYYGALSAVALLCQFKKSLPPGESQRRTSSDATIVSHPMSAQIISSMSRHRTRRFRPDLERTISCVSKVSNLRYIVWIPLTNFRFVAHSTPCRTFTLIIFATPIFLQFTAIVIATILCVIFVQSWKCPCKE